MNYYPVHNIVLMHIFYTLDDLTKDDDYIIEAVINFFVNNSSKVFTKIFHDHVEILPLLESFFDSYQIVVTQSAQYLDFSDIFCSLRLFLFFLD